MAIDEPASHGAGVLPARRPNARRDDGAARGDDSGRIDLDALLEELAASTVAAPIAAADGEDSHIRVRAQPTSAAVIHELIDIADASDDAITAEVDNPLLALSPIVAPADAPLPSRAAPAMTGAQRVSPPPAPPTKHAARLSLSTALGLLALLTIGGALAIDRARPTHAKVEPAQAPARDASGVATLTRPREATTTAPVTLPPITNGESASPAVTALAPARGAAAAKTDAPAIRALVTAVDLPTSPEPTKDDLAAAMKQATGAQQPAAAVDPHPTANHATTLRPAAGALNATIASALRDARACLAADDPEVHAVLTFAAEGTAAVTLGSGASALAESRSCLTQALSHARVAAFVEGPISVPVVVRP